MGRMPMRTDQTQTTESKIQACLTWNLWPGAQTMARYLGTNGFNWANSTPNFFQNRTDSYLIRACPEQGTIRCYILLTAQHTYDWKAERYTSITFANLGLYLTFAVLFYKPGYWEISLKQSCLGMFWTKKKPFSWFWPKTVILFAKSRIEKMDFGFGRTVNIWIVEQWEIDFCWLSESDHQQLPHIMLPTVVHKLKGEIVLHSFWAIKWLFKFSQSSMIYYLCDVTRLNG